jgi:formylmethanofuran dehydrogenase subunit E
MTKHIDCFTTEETKGTEERRVREALGCSLCGELQVDPGVIDSTTGTRRAQEHRVREALGCYLCGELSLDPRGDVTVVHF